MHYTKYYFRILVGTGTYRVTCTLQSLPNRIFNAIWNKILPGYLKTQILKMLVLEIGFGWHEILLILLIQIYNILHTTGHQNKK